MGVGEEMRRQGDGGICSFDFPFKQKLFLLDSGGVRSNTVLDQKLGKTVGLGHAVSGIKSCLQQ